jgi:Protein of unknown function (DUF3119)
MPTVTSSTSANSFTDIELSPSYNIALVIIAATIPLVWIQVWLALVVGLFGLFLLVQTALIRLKFTATALEVYRLPLAKAKLSGKEIRSFPYAEWEEWRIFWQPVPILFYFREVNSIHFLPMLFDAEQLHSCLEQHCHPQ